MATYELRRDGEELRPTFTTIEPGVLTGQLAPESTTALIEVFCTPLDSDWDLSTAAHAVGDQEIALGPVPTHIVSARRVQIPAGRNFVYDLFVTDEVDGARQIVGGGRYAVTDAEGYQVPTQLTFDQARYLGARALGLTEKQAETTWARVTPMSGWGSTLGRVAMVRFDLRPWDVGFGSTSVTVEHDGFIDVRVVLTNSGTSN